MTYPYVNQKIEGGSKTDTSISMRNLIVKSYSINSTNEKNKILPFLEGNDTLSKVYYKGLKDTGLYKDGEDNNIDFIEIEKSAETPSLANISILSDLFGKAEQKLTVNLDASTNINSLKYRFKVTVLLDLVTNGFVNDYNISTLGLKLNSNEVNNAVITKNATKSEIFQSILEYLTDNNIVFESDISKFEIKIYTYNSDQPELSFINFDNQLSSEELNILNTSILDITKFQPTTLSFNNGITSLSVEKGMLQTDFNTLLQNHFTTNSIDFTFSNNEYLIKSVDKSTKLIITPSDGFVIVNVTQTVKFNDVILTFSYLTESVQTTIQKVNDTDTDDIFLLQILTPDFKTKIGDGLIKTINSKKVLEIINISGFNESKLSCDNLKISVEGFSGGSISKYEFEKYIPEGIYDNIVFLSDLYGSSQPNSTNNSLRESVFKNIDSFIKTSNDSNPPEDFIGFVSVGNFDNTAYNVVTEFKGLSLQNKSFLPVSNIINETGDNGSVNSDILALCMCLIRTIRLTENSNLTNYLQDSVGVDNFTGGYHLINVPYHNTILTMLDGVVDTSKWYSKNSQLKTLAEEMIVSSVDKEKSKLVGGSSQLVTLNLFTTSTQDVFNKLEVRDLELYWRKLCFKLIKTKLGQNKISSRNNINRGTYSVVQIKSFITNLYFQLYQQGLVDDVNKFNETLNVTYDSKIGKLTISNYVITNISGIDFVDNKGIII